MSVAIGIHDGHNAAVAVVRDGVVEFALQEERLTRIKNQGDAPAGALKLARAVAPDAAAIALNGRYMNYRQWERHTIVSDYQRSRGVGSRVRQGLKGSWIDRHYQRNKADARIEALGNVGVDARGARPIDHHLAHACAAYYTSPWPGGTVLVFTCDGSGDRLSATVSIGQGGELKRIAQVSEDDSIGRLYSLITWQLGMVPLEHEYKVMGLAPYADARQAESLARDFLGLFRFSKNPLEWSRAHGVPPISSCDSLVRRLTAGRRFDVVACGVQQFLEKMLATWIGNAIRETGIRRIACAGGVFMNVKANLTLLELPQVEEMYVAPSCGDELNSIGAACCAAQSMGDSMRPLEAMYYGEPIDDAACEEALRTARAAGKLRTSHESDIEKVTAERLAEGKIVGRVAGQAEFGARALGNRSILARADSRVAVDLLNQAIKSRDFWMPFAPSVLAERASEYYDKPKSAASPHMMFAFRSKPSKRSSYIAAQHPFDFTTRPQEVFGRHNAAYYRLLKAYEECTGEGILLNTSFNLHGEPMVHSAADAVDVFLRSGLQYMALGNWWVEKAAA